MQLEISDPLYVTMGLLTYNASDLDSPGYEYLRSYRAMSSLYYKLIALDYQGEFCPLYKCPPINKFYFAIQSANQMEQQFSFMCLCVWLMKDKCQMNFDMDPRDYQDLDSTVSVIFDALKLLLNSNGKQQQQQQQLEERSLFPVGRLKQGFGPEVIYCLNRFADRALELTLEDNPKIGQVEIIYHDKQRGAREHQQARHTTSNNSIVIGQPIVGGGLTTRPLGNYQVDDSSLVFDYDGASDASPDDRGEEHLRERTSTTNGGEWQQEKLDKIAPLFELDYGTSSQESWLNLLNSVRQARDNVKRFMEDSMPALETMSTRLERQMQAISNKEASLNARLEKHIVSFLGTWREHSELQRKNSRLNEEINQKTDTFEHYADQLQELRTREVKVDDKSRLVELERLTQRLSRETQAMDLKLGLLLAGACRTGSPKR